MTGVELYKTPNIDYYIKFHHRFSQIFLYLCNMQLPNITGKNVLIIGPPASGKTYISKLLSKSGHKVIHTDDYLKYGYDQDVLKLLLDLMSFKENTIVEGTLGYRALRKGLEFNEYFPDMVIELRVSEEQMYKIYAKERSPEKIKFLERFIKGNETVLKKYKKMKNSKSPEWVIIENDYIVV